MGAVPARGQEVTSRSSMLNRHLLQNTITGIGRDELGFLWVSTQFGIYRYDGASVRSFTAGTGPVRGSNRFGSLVPLNRSNQLLTHTESGPYQVSNGNIKPWPLPEGSYLLKNLSGALLLPGSNTHRNLSRLAGAHTIIEYLLPLGIDTLAALPDGLYSLRTGRRVQAANNRRRLYAVVAGEVYALDGGGIYRLHYNGRELRQSTLLRLAGTKRIISNSQGQFWFQNNQTLHRFVPATGTLNFSLPIPASGDLDVVTAIFADTFSGTLFLGTATSGLQEVPLFNGTVLAAPPSVSAENYIYTYSPHGGKGYYSITPSGLVYYHPSAEKAHRLLYPGMLNLSFVATDSAGRVWFGNQDRELLALDPASRKVVARHRWATHIKQLHFLDAHRALVVSEDAVDLFFPASGRLRTLYRPQPGNPILCATFYQHKLYVGTQEGLFVAGLPQPIISQTVRALLPLGRLGLAVGSYGGGTYLLRAGRLHTLPSGPYGIARAVVNLSMDADSALWVIANRGAVVWQQRQLADTAALHKSHPGFFLETNTDLPVSELNGGQTPQFFTGNRIVLPASKGLVVFDKNAVLRKNAPYSIGIDQVLVDGQPQPIHTRFRVAPGNRQVTLLLVAPYFGSVNNLGAAYRLRGLDTNWQQLDNTRRLSFARMQPGNYQFEVRLHPNSNPHTLLRFEVLPFWYQRPLVWTMGGLLLLALFYLVYQSRVLVMQRRQRSLETVIADKTQALRKTVRQLSQTNKELVRQQRDKSRLYSILMHDLRSPLQFLSRYSVEQWLLRQKGQPVAADSLKVMAETSTELSDFINQFLTWLGNQTTKMELNLQPVAPGRILEDVVQLYQHVTLLNNNRLLLFCACDAGTFTTDADLLRTIVRNLIDNANKYTRNGVIKVSCGMEGNVLTINIEDSGKGIPPPVAAQLELGAGSPFEPSINANHKMGLQICREFIGRLNGQITIQSHEGEGSSIFLRFPPMRQEPLTGTATK